MKKTLLLVSIICSTFIITSAQTNFSLKLYAGSNASWGNGQFLSIDSKGNCKYNLSEMNNGIKDSLSFVITKDQLNQLEEVTNKIQFFKLNPTYDAKMQDGTRLSIEISTSGKTKTVHWLNIHNNESDLFLDKLNTVLKNKGIIINY